MSTIHFPEIIIGKKKKKKKNVCVEVLWPSQPNGVMSSAVNFPNHIFIGQAYFRYVANQYCANSFSEKECRQL